MAPRPRSAPSWVGRGFHFHGDAMHYPSLDDVKAQAARGEGNLVPIYREILADLETPVSAFLKVKRGDYSFLLESIEGGERPARYSFIGTEPYGVLRAESGPDARDPLTLLQEEMERFTLVRNPNLPPFHGGAVGYLAYEVISHFEPRVPRAQRDPLQLPEALFQFVDTVLVFDHLKHVIKVVGHVRLNGDVDAAYREAQVKIDELVRRLADSPPQIPVDGPRPPQAGVVRSNVDREVYLSNVERIVDYIIAGDVVQCVYSQRFSRETFSHPFNVYRTLRAINPSPYTYYLEMGDHQIIGTSPELLVVFEEGKVATHPIAGTRPRGADAEEDARLEAELLTDEKERAEHVMLLDLGRNDIGRLSVPGSVRVTQLMDVERYSHVMHMVSHVEGEVQPGVSCYDAIRATFPAGTVSGAPKIRAMEIIAELEEDERGPYAGALGYFGFGGNMETAITIRTIVMQDGGASVQAGGGIVFDSKPEAEYQETVNKAMALISALDMAEARSLGRRSGSLGY